MNIQFQTDAASALNGKVNAIVVGAAQVLTPAAPSNLIATAPTSSRIDLAWSDNSANETSFQIDVSTDGVNYTTVAVVGANVTSFSQTGLNPSSTYSYHVRACNAAGCSSPASATAQTQGSVPTAPSNLVGTAQGGSQINLSWTDNSSNENGFTIESSLNGTTFSVIGSVGPEVTTFASTGLKRSTRYYFRVRAFNSLGTSAASNTLNIRTKAK